MVRTIKLMYVYMQINNMKKITFEIEDDLDDKFRKAIAVTKGIRKGVIGEALEEAITEWLAMQKKRGKNNG